MLRIPLLFSLLFTACGFVSAQNKPTGSAKPEKMMGLLWEISGNGAPKKGFLYGTMHVSEKLVFNLSDSFFHALNYVDQVALETDHDLWQPFSEALQKGMKDNDFQFGFGFGSGFEGYKNLYGDAFKFTTPANDMLGAMLSSKPVMTNEYLYRSNQWRQDHEEDTYLDLFIFQAGKKLGKKVIGLETLEGSYEAVTRAQMIPDDDPEPPSAFGFFDPGKMEEAYRNQDLHLLDSLNRLVSPGKNFNRWMLDERNIIMANGIDSILRSGTALFSAVGAAHLPGDMGVIKLLRKKGYTVRAVKFTDANGNKDREAIEKMRFPVKFSEQRANDGAWTAQAPGKFYSTVDFKGFEQYLSADMSNGAFYAVYRLKTFGWWTGQSPQYVADRLDSLVYEKIPGKIQERKRFSSPFPGHEVTTRTRRGDIYRYKIFATPFEIIVFNTGGNGDFALGESAELFFNSIRFSEQMTQARPGAMTLQPVNGGCTVRFPASIQLNSTGDPDASKYMAAGIDPADSTFYFLYRTDYQDWDFIEEDSFELNIIGEKIAEQFTKTKPTVTNIAETPYPTQDIRFRSDRDGAWYFTRLVVDGPHYYLLGCRRKSADYPREFFESFAVTPKQYPEGWKDLTDTVMNFKAKIPLSTDKPVLPFLLRLRKIMEEGQKKREDLLGYGGYEDPYDNGWKTLKSTTSGEEISIRKSEYSPSEFVPTLDSFKTSIRKMLTRDGKLSVLENGWQEKDGLLSANFLLGDTNSTRGIRAKVMVVNRKVYTLKTTVNLKAPESPFVQSVFSSFTPTDKSTGISIFDQLDLGFLRDLYAKDSTVRAKALKDLKKSWSADLKPEYFKDLTTALEHPGFHKLKFKDREILIGAISGFKNETAVQYLSRFFHVYADSIRYQAAVIEALGKMQTSASFKTLFELWKERPVFSSNTDFDFTQYFRDTLELSARFVPEILRLAELPVYKDRVYDLLEALLEKNLIKPKVYSKLKPSLIQEAHWSIAQQRFQAETKREKNKSGESVYDYYDYSFGPNGMGANLRRSLSLLAPFIKKDPEVKAVMEHAANSGEKQLALMAYGYYLQNGIPVSEAQLKPFSQDDKTHASLYRNLALAGKLGQYSAWFTDTSALLRSYLVENAGGRTLDSVRFVSKHKAVLYSKPATIFFFDVKTKKAENWGLAYIIAPKDMAFLTRPLRQNTYYDPGDPGSDFRLQPEIRVLPELTGKNKDDIIRKRIGEMRFANRERYRADDPQDNLNFLAIDF